MVFLILYQTSRKRRKSRFDIEERQNVELAAASLCDPKHEMEEEKEKEIRKLTRLDCFV